MGHSLSDRLRSWLLQPLTEAVMADLNEIKNKIADLTTAVAANTDATNAVTEYVTGLKEQLSEIQAALDAALADAASPEELQEISDGLSAAIDAIDADAVAEAALANTDAGGNE